MISKTQPKTVFINKANNQSLNVTLPRFDKYSDFLYCGKKVVLSTKKMLG